MNSLTRRYVSDSSGATAIEYGLLAALIGVALIGGGGQLGFEIDTLLSKLSDRLALASAR